MVLLRSAVVVPHSGRGRDGASPERRPLYNKLIDASSVFHHFLSVVGNNSSGCRERTYAVKPVVRLYMRLG